MGAFGIIAIITDPTVVEKISTTTSSPGATHYEAPELLNPKQFDLTHSNLSKESNVCSFAITSYGIFSSYLAARVINFSMTRSSQTTHGGEQESSQPFVLQPATGYPAQITRRQATDYPIKSRMPFSPVGSKIRSLGCPFIHYIKHSLDQNRRERGIPQSVGKPKAKLCGSLANSFLEPICRYNTKGT